MRQLLAIALVVAVGACGKSEKEKQLDDLEKTIDSLTETVDVPKDALAALRRLEPAYFDELAETTARFLRPVVHGA